VFPERAGTGPADLFEQIPADQMDGHHARLPLSSKEDDRLENLAEKKLKGSGPQDGTDHAISLYGERGLCHFGVYIIHTSVLILMAGIVIGFLFGF